ncbi:MAG: nucleoside kinase, partial [Lentisphaerae bacterium]|nr:nucleoside kinase [Lentisphaerota bacterium]
LGVTTVGALNAVIARNAVDEVIRTVEALHEKKLARIADQITERHDTVKVILVAGPSSAGKTTFAKRLATQLAVNGLRPVALAMDDYFVGPERNPRDEAGKPDFEHLDAVDVDLLNRNLEDLIAGKAVELPRYDFANRRRTMSGQRLSVEDKRMIILEGIHGLNPDLTPRIPAERKFHIYINALTQLSVDANNRISTTDNRLMRRIVRDHRFRGYTTLETLRQWPSVRRGEKRWVFPFQRRADATFNSALDYELAVLKPVVEPLLAEVKPCHVEYAEARRLSEFLLNFAPAPGTAVPGTSILREYIGHSVFSY